jgi:signal transduction histidine kinase
VEEGQNDILPNRFSQTESITLKYFQNSFSFDYGHVDFITPARRHTIQFKLENYDNYWRASKGENRANYVKVPPGNYVLNIRASNPGGVWSSRSVKMVILNPWYQTGWAYLLFTLLGASLLRGYIIYRSRKLKAENIFLEEKVAKRTAALKASQAQLIHSEKMASLGELTAGIAHEIQNPLNFVNNFSEINQELLEEVEEEIGNGNLEDAKDIIHDLKENEQKISEHGKRADSIVKGMLLHSRNSTGEKIETDINALCDEYLRLSYHGMRAKNRDFNVDFELNMDPDLPKVKVVPQDMGRVLLNIINNAFQALTDFKERNETSDKASSPVRGGLETFKGVNSPKVFVSTKRVATPLGDGGREQAIQITISDNGPGIPDYLKEKIFQPFFTTKATGEGTGLGLSLAYDIVKAHGGEIKVESEEGGGARFTLYLPVIN